MPQTSSFSAETDPPDEIALFPDHQPDRYIHRDPAKLVKSSAGLIKLILIIGGIVGTAVIAILHHIFDEHLDGRDVNDSSWSQTNSRRVENALATAFKILFSASAGASLCQVAWHRVRKVSFRISDLDSLLSYPSWTSILYPNLIIHTPVAIAMIIAITASVVIPIFAPSLTVRSGGQFSRDITVPVLDLATDKNIGSIHVSDPFYGSVSETWEKATLQAIVANEALGWPMPSQCAPACQYNVTYAATALQCSDLLPNQISDGLFGNLSKLAPPHSPTADPPSAYLFGYDSDLPATIAVLNLTIEDWTRMPPTGINGSDRYGLTLVYSPFDQNTTRDGPTAIPAYGSTCTFYNATYLVQVAYFNSTQINSVAVVEYHNPLNTSYKNAFNLYGASDPGFDPNAPFAPGIGAQINLLAMADAISDYLEGAIDWSLLKGGFRPDNGKVETLITKTNLFVMQDDESAGSLSLNANAGVTNLSQSLTDLVANITLSFMALNLGNTSVVAISPSTSSVYQYNRHLLIITYTVAFILLLISGLLGISALAANGVASSNTFSHVLETTRNPRLDALYSRSVAAGGKGFGDVRLRFRQGLDGSPAAFHIDEDDANIPLWKHHG